MDHSDSFKEIDLDIRSCLEKTGGAQYDNRAKFYEWLVSTWLFNRMTWGTTTADYKNFAREPVLHSTGKLIDIGCGGLAQTSGLYAATANHCTLVDRSVEMLKIARSRLIAIRGAMPPNINLLQADAFHLPFPDNSFDTLCSFGTIHLFDNKQDFVNEALRMLKIGGKFYFSTMTTEKTISKWFMLISRTINAFGELFSAAQTLALFDKNKYKVESYMIGSVLFIKGQKSV